MSVLFKTMFVLIKTVFVLIKTMSVFKQNDTVFELVILKDSVAEHIGIKRIMITNVEA